MFGSELKSDEEVIIYPGYLYLDSNLKEYKVKLHVQVFKKKEDSLKRKLLMEYLKAYISSKNKDSRVLEERMRPFLVDNKRGKEISVSVLEKKYILNKTEANGHSTTEITISPNKITNKELVDKTIEVKVILVTFFFLL